MLAPPLVLPKRAFVTSVSGIRRNAPRTGPHKVPIPPIIAITPIFIENLALNYFVDL